MVSGDSSVIQRLRIERSVRRATLLAVIAVLIAAGAIVAAATGVFSSDPEEPPTASEIIAQVKPSTVRVLTRVDERSSGAGTGWVYDGERGLVVTNAHVVGDQETPGLTTYRVLVDDKPRPATLYGNSPCYDIAMLEVDDAAGLETLPLGAQADLAQGEQVNVIGYPSNEFTNFASTPLQSNTGTVSVVEESVQSRSEAGAHPDTRRYPNVVQTDAAINHGNSGGPLVDDAGNLVGINSLTTLETQGQGFAIGVDLFKEQAPTLEQGDSIGFLGFDFVANGKGLVVNNAVEGSEAADAGFGSEVAVVTAIDGHPVRTRADYCRVAEAAEPGQMATVSGVTRGGRFEVELPYL
jgi:S1-C subfamily serine protease